MPAAFDDYMAGEPRIIKVQAGTPVVPSAPPGVPGATSAPPATPGSPAPKLYRWGKQMLPADEVRARAEAAMMDPELRPFAVQKLKELDGDREDRALDKSAKGEVEKTMVSQVNHLARLQNIGEQYAPNIAKYLNVKYRLGQAYNATAEKFGGRLSPEQSKELGDYTTFRADSARNLNTLLKELSGAAVTQQEYERLLLAEPNAGSGSWTDIVNADSPSQYVAKLQAGMKGAKLAIARANFLRTSRNFSDQDIAAMARASKGEDLGGISLPGMEKIMSRERARIEESIRARAPSGNGRRGRAAAPGC